MGKTRSADPSFTCGAPRRGRHPFPRQTREIIVEKNTMKGASSSRRRARGSRANGNASDVRESAFGQDTQQRESHRGCLRDSDYYGSMSAGSIVGAARGGAAASSCGAANQASPRRPNNPSSSSGGGNSRSSARREPRSSGVQRPEHFCRSSLVPQFESLAKIPESRLVATESGRPPNMLLAHGDTPVATPARTVWLVCTSNALTVYDGPSRRARIATLSTRKLYAVEPGAPPLLVQGEQQAPVERDLRGGSVVAPSGNRTTRF